MRSRNGSNGQSNGHRAMTRNLAAVDAALAGDPVDPDLAEIAELSLLLRAERPKAPVASSTISTPSPESISSRRFAGQGMAAAPRERPHFGVFFARRRPLPLPIGAVASLFISRPQFFCPGSLDLELRRRRRARPSAPPAERRATLALGGGSATRSPPALERPAVPSAPTDMLPARLPARSSGQHR